MKRILIGAAAKEKKRNEIIELSECSSNDETCFATHHPCNEKKIMELDLHSIERVSGTSIDSPHKLFTECQFVYNVIINN
jgi:hypothetical protein